MEREVVLTGIGGQGIQLAAQILARAATLEGRHVLYLGTYGGAMRGGNTDSTVIVGDEPIGAPPLVSRTWSAVAMHHAFWEPLRHKLRSQAVVVVNSTLFASALGREDVRRFDVPATQVATDLGNALTAALVLIGAYASLTGLVSSASLVEAMRQSVPPYRRQHVEANERALRAGCGTVPANAAPAWLESGATP
jgi:Pyruvate/2-oxoacid:ferredoxin oxidoreductase gamma subunit